ncbi:MAG: diacylglycerol/lipid kinase family protein [Acutalibacter sp.]|jgi:diacylglycerol kinase (ATP)
MREVWILANAQAGRRHARENGEAVRQVFDQGGCRTQMTYTETVQQAQEFLDRAASAHPDLVVCCGGDGTLSLTVNYLGELGAALPLGYVPMGTTNDFAASLGLSKDPAKAAQQILQGSPKVVDLGAFNQRRFLYVASFGAFTQSSYRAAPMAKAALGHFAYVLEGARELPCLRPCPAQVETDGGKFSGEFLFGAVSSSTSIGGVLKLDPAKVQLDDGLLELTLVRMPKNPVELGQALLMLQKGNADGELVILRQVRQAAFSCQEEFPWSLDGEYVPGDRQVDIQVLPGAVELVL